jgi:hypothetical protein
LGGSGGREEVMEDDGHVGGEDVVHFFATGGDKGVFGVKARVVLADLAEEEVHELCVCVCVCEKVCEGGVGMENGIERQTSI